VSIVSVRPFLLSDLGTAAELCDRARKRDPSVEPFGQRLALLATGPRARVDLWRIAQDEEGVAQGIAFAALRQPRSESAPAVLDVYATVASEMRRQGLGRALCEKLLGEPAVLRARVREESIAGRAFLRALGFSETSAQLSLSWSARPLEQRPTPGLRLRRAERNDAPAVELLSREAWAGVPDAFAPRADEVVQLFTESERLVLLAEVDRREAGYLSAVWLGGVLGIEEIAVLPRFRRAGIARALVIEALRGAGRGVLSVAESNSAARALYEGLGFTPCARRPIYELRRGA
jgi:ribosomal protein S18 acetylase RimI-like enzyme